LWFADLQTEELPSNSVVEFTFFWIETQRCEGRNWQISIGLLAERLGAAMDWLT
jgi:hypothetical protein